MYVLDCLQDGLDEDQIVKNCDGETQMVKSWIDFIKENQWVIKDGASNRWVLTDKGRQQMTSYFHA